MEATIHYLNWDEEHREDGEEPGPATDLFHDLGIESRLEEDEKPPTQYTEEEFDQLYREVATLDRDIEEASMAELEEIWREWNAGSRHESQEFYDAQVRSMSMGDVVELDGEYYQAKAAGWEEIQVGGEVQ